MKPKKVALYQGRLSVLNDAFQDMIDAYIEESVSHFLQKQKMIKDDGRYFYKRVELLEFIKQYQEKGGNLSKLHIGIVYDCCHEFLCYEVCTKEYYDGSNIYAKKVIEGSTIPIYHS